MFLDTRHSLCQACRVDWRLDNLTAFEEAGPPPPQDARGLDGYHVPWINLFILRGEAHRREAYNRRGVSSAMGNAWGQRWPQRRRSWVLSSGMQQRQADAAPILLGAL